MLCPGPGSGPGSCCPAGSPGRATSRPAAVPPPGLLTPQAARRPGPVHPGLRVIGRAVAELRRQQERTAPARGRQADGSCCFSPSNQRRRLGGGRGRGSAPGCLDSNARREPQGRRRRRSERRARCPLAPGRGMSGGEEAEAEPGAGGAIPAAPSPPAEEGDTRQRYEELCSSLNMDERARSEAWLSYQSMKRNYTLEVRPGPGGGVKGGGRRGGFTLQR